MLGTLRDHAEIAPRSAGRRGAAAGNRGARGSGARCASHGGGAGDGGVLGSAVLVINSRGETASDLARSIGATGQVYAIFADIEARARAGEVGDEPSGAPSAAPTRNPGPCAAPGSAVATPNGDAADEAPINNKRPPVTMFDLNESESDNE